MRKVGREEVVDWQTWSDRRAAEQPRVLAAKELRRVHVAEHLTLLFENAETIRYQVQEMLRVERIVREADVRHEIDTYNELIGGDGELGCTLLVGIDDPAARAEKLARWVDLPDRLYLKLPGGALVRPRIDERQRSSGKLSTVQYLTFAVGREAPLAAGCDHPEQRGETELRPEQRAALAEDLAS